LDTTTNAWARLGLTLSLLATSGCANAREVSHVPGDLACAPTQLRSAWWTEGSLQTNRHGSHLIGVTDHGERAGIHDLFRRGVLRLRDGHFVGLEDGGAETAGLRFTREGSTFDADGRRDLAGATEIMEAGRTEPLRIVPWLVPRDAEHTTGVEAAMTSDMTRAFLLESTSELGATRARMFLRQVDVSEPGRDRSVELGVSERDPFGVASFWVDEAREVAFVALEGPPEDDEVALVRADMSGTITRVSLSIRQTDRLLGRAAVGAPETRVLDLAASSDGTTLFVSGRDGLLRVLDAETLEPIGESRSVGVAVANEDSYLPSVRSPIALSARDHWLASLDLEGRVVLTDRATGAVAATLETAAPARAPSDWARPERTPMAIRFLPDGLVVTRDGGTRRFPCRGI